MDVPEGLPNDVEAALSALDQVPLLQYCFEGPELRCVMMNAQIRPTPPQHPSAGPGRPRLTTAFQLGSLRVPMSSWATSRNLRWLVWE